MAATARPSVGFGEPAVADVRQQFRVRLMVVFQPVVGRRPALGEDQQDRQREHDEGDEHRQQRLAGEVVERADGRTIATASPGRNTHG